MMPSVSMYQLRLLASTKPSSFKPLQSPSHKHQGLRGLITSSTPPPINVEVERPEPIVLVESSLYRQQWRESFSSFYPCRGMHFISLDISIPKHATEDDTTLDSMERTLSADLDDFSSSAHTILIARGPLQSLVAQYYLESLPLAGLVLIDPLVLPEDRRNISDPCDSAEERCPASVTCLLNMLGDKLVPEQVRDCEQQRASIEPPLDPKKESLAKSSLSELKLLQSLLHLSSRPLFLEPHSVPILIMYSGHHVYQEYYKSCAQRTAKFHFVSDDNNLDNLVLKIPARKNESGIMEGDCEWAMERIFEWYDEFVA